jgi:hypothetical protein
LGRDVALDEDSTQALVVLASRAFTKGALQRRLEITSAMPVPPAWLSHAGLGEERVAGAAVERGTLVATIERVYAGRVLSSRKEPPKGAAAREAVRDLVLRGRLFKKTAELRPQRLEALALAAQISDGAAPPPEAEWLLQRLESLGLESGSDLPLLSGQDLLPPSPPPDVVARLEKDFPTRLKTGDATYRISYDVASRAAVLHQISGTRKTPPADMFLPRLPGWRISWEHKNRVRLVRDRR